MNAGAYGGEMSGIISWVEAYHPDEDKVERHYANDLLPGYRTSRFLRENEAKKPGELPKSIIISAAMQLKKGNSEEIKAKMRELYIKRKEKQPLEYPSAGSTFKRPEGHFAGKLIEDAGLKGHSIGGAMVSEKHCGFIINKGGATASDILELINFVKDRVKESSGVLLEEEVRILKSGN